MRYPPALDRLQVTRAYTVREGPAPEPAHIQRAMFELHTPLVRVWLSDDTEAHTPDDESTPLGRQLQEWKKGRGLIEQYEPPPITAYDVDKERDRRNSRGQELFLKSGKVISIKTASREDFDNINFASDTALTMIAKTIPALAADAEAIDPKAAPTLPLMKFRDFYNAEVEVTFHEMAEISVRVTDNIVAVHQAAHLLKDQYPTTPRDYTDDQYWPTIPLPPGTPP
jgi:hypothetical protein